jgi:hypothetical protein
MSISTPSKGTHFSDGVRTGPILGSQFVAGANVLTPSPQVSSAIDSQPPGVFNTPMSLLNSIPAPVVTNLLAAAQTPAAAGYLTLIAVSAQGASVITYQSISGVLQLDVPRNITLTGVGGTAATNFTVFGWDQYGQPTVEQINHPGGAVTASGNKAFLYVRAIYASAGTTNTIAAGVGNTFGLSHYVSSSNYIGNADWGGYPDNTTTVFLANNPLHSANGTGVITVTVPNTAALINNQLVTISGAVGFDGITTAELNITAAITVVNGTSFTYTTAGTGTAGIAGGGSNVSYTTNALGGGYGVFVVGDPRTATATTGDVRGTYTPASNANGIKRLTINYYSASGDARNYNAAVPTTTVTSSGVLGGYVQGPVKVILNNNPISNTNASPLMNIFAPNHQFTNGENVTIAGGTGTIGGITAANYNITAPVTIVDANNFTYTNASGANGTGGTGGGALVTMSPALGNLYQLPVGRYGVTQYTVALF